jgi:glycosyltransferase involved in cell wall biosynthesis
MESKLPTISIITVCRNSEKYLEQCIQSVVSQTYRDIEYIVIDGGSTDRTLDIIKKYENKITRWISEPDKGIYDAMNKGNKLANGDYILFLNSDDYLYSKDSIKKALTISCDKEMPLLIIAKVKVAIDNEVLDQNYGFTNSIFPGIESICHQAILIKKDIYKKIPYNTKYKIAGDFDLWLKLQNLGLLKPKYIDQFLTVFRLGGAATKDTRALYSRYIERQKIYFAYRKNAVLFAFGLLRSILIATVKAILEMLFGKKICYKNI